MPESSNLAKGKTYKTLKEVTNKLIGRLDMILRKAAIRSLLQGHHKVDLDILKQIMASMKWSYERKNN